jgi:3-deoxy-manno-octulosonate cytidylyltransferase (CMP-KDO synthetase)
MKQMKIIIGIPVRMGSSRLPGKPLRKILGITMVEHVCRRCALSKYASNIYVAACDQEIKEQVESFGGTVIMTSPEITRPGLRVAAAMEKLELDDEDIVVVVQGDEPLVHPDMIDMAIEPLLNEKDVFVSNLAGEIATDDEWKDPNEIKVVTDLQMNAIYMSRSPIPSIDHEEEPAVRLKQICIMPFKWHFMKTFNALPATPLEKAESIEMIRAIQHGYKVRMVMSTFVSKSVDTEQDRLDVEKIMQQDPIYQQYGF